MSYAPLAQLVEHLTLNQGVQGSSPWRCTIPLDGSTIQWGPHDARHGPLVKWLRQRPLTPLTSVRIRYGSPFLKRLDNLIKVCYCTKAVTIQQLVLIRARVHPFPSRTRKLSSLLLTILGWRRPGKIGGCRIYKRVLLLSMIRSKNKHSWMAWSIRPEV